MDTKLAAIQPLVLAQDIARDALRNPALGLPHGIVSNVCVKRRCLNLLAVTVRRQIAGSVSPSANALGRDCATDRELLISAALEVARIHGR